MSFTSVARASREIGSCRIESAHLNQRFRAVMSVSRVCAQPASWMSFTPLRDFYARPTDQFRAVIARSRSCAPIKAYNSSPRRPLMAGLSFDHPERESRMKITRVTPWLIHADVAYYFGRRGTYLFVEVNTDEGVV